MKFKGLTIGIPKEIMKGERRVAAIPDTVRKMVAEGAAVIVEEGAGSGSYFSDEDYKEAGATLFGDVEALFRESDIILKVKEPLFNEDIYNSLDLLNCVKRRNIPGGPAPECVSRHIEYIKESITSRA